MPDLEEAKLFVIVGRGSGLYIEDGTGSWLVGAFFHKSDAETFLSELRKHFKKHSPHEIKKKEINNLLVLDPNLITYEYVYYEVEEVPLLLHPLRLTTINQKFD